MNSGVKNFEFEESEAEWATVMHTATWNNEELHTHSKLLDIDENVLTYTQRLMFIRRLPG